MQISNHHQILKNIERHSFIISTKIPVCLDLTSLLQKIVLKCLWQVICPYPSLCFKLCSCSTKRVKPLSRYLSIQFTKFPFAHFSLLFHTEIHSVIPDKQAVIVVPNLNLSNSKLKMIQIPCLNSLGTVFT